jgi:hypothetical protein
MRRNLATPERHRISVYNSLFSFCTQEAYQGHPSADTALPYVSKIEKDSFFSHAVVLHDVQIVRPKEHKMLVLLIQTQQRCVGLSGYSWPSENFGRICIHSCIRLSLYISQVPPRLIHQSRKLLLESSLLCSLSYVEVARAFR